MARSYTNSFQHSDEVPEFPTTTSHLSDSKKEDTEYLDTAPKTSTPVHDINEEDGLIQPMHSYLLSLTMILVSEIGDKTFLIAALMAMKHDRAIVFSAALSALVAMTVLSAVLGHAVPALLSKRFTGFLAGILFLIFGARMMKEGIAMDSNEGVGAEMQEVELELEEKEEELRQQGHRRNSSISPYALEMGLGRGTRKSRSKSRIPSPPRSPSSSRGSSPSRGSSIKGAIAGFSNLLSLLLSPAWVQTFVMTFLGEWGDRSQIATIAMAAGSDYWWVTAGAISGHAVCTGIAVIGGRAIAGRVSLRMGKSSMLVCSMNYMLSLNSYPWRCHCIPCLWCGLSSRDHVLGLNDLTSIDLEQVYNIRATTIHDTAESPIIFPSRILSFHSGTQLYYGREWSRRPVAFNIRHSEELSHLG